MNCQIKKELNNEDLHLIRLSFRYFVKYLANLSVELPAGGYVGELHLVLFSSESLCEVVNLDVDFWCGDLESHGIQSTSDVLVNVRMSSILPQLFNIHSPDLQELLDLPVLPDSAFFLHFLRILKS